MKKIFSILSLVMVLYACQPDAIPSMGEPTDYKVMLAGTWKLVKFVQIDADAESKSFPEFAMKKELTNIFAEHPYTDFSFTFKADGTFTTSVGRSYVQMLSDGTWTLDSEEYPSAVILKKGDVTQRIALGSLAGLILGKVEFKEERKQQETGKVKIKYTYSLEKQ